MRDLSIIVPTCNRAPLLARCLQRISETTACDYEVIVVNGASTDETATVLEDAKAVMGGRLSVISETLREGFVRAANKGFRSATGRCVTWINDDARPVGKSLDNAVEQVIQSNDFNGLVAMFHHYDGERNIAYQTDHAGRTYSLLHIRGTLYANFGLGLLSTFRDLGFFDERFFLNGADPDLSLKVWHAGLYVVPAEASFIDHDEHDDARRASDGPRAQEDNRKLFAKWNLPPVNPLRNDFDYRNPCTLRGINTLAA